MQFLAKIRLSDILWLVAFNTLFFQGWIQNTFGFTLADEIATVALCLAACVKGLGTHWDVRGMSKNMKLAIAFLVLTCAIGFFGNMRWSVQGSLSAIAIDFFTCIKFPIAALSACAIFRNNERILVLVEAEAKFLTFLMFILAIANLFADFGMGHDSRYGLRASFEFVLGHPTAVVATGAGLAVVLSNKRMQNALWLAMILAVICLSLRSKGIAFVVLAVFFLLVYGKHERISAFHIFLGVVFVAFLGYDQYLGYFTVDGYARRELTNTAFSIAGNFFPIGGGFASYGSAVTANLDTYSPLYFQYGLSGVQGLAPGHATFLSDTFWPTVLGQFGWLGLATYAASLMFIFKHLYQVKGARLGVILCFSYLLISSIAESAFFNPFAIYLALCLGFTFSRSDQGLKPY